MLLFGAGTRTKIREFVVLSIGRAEPGSLADVTRISRCSAARICTVSSVKAGFLGSCKVYIGSRMECMEGLCRVLFTRCHVVVLELLRFSTVS